MVLPLLGNCPPKVRNENLEIRDWKPETVLRSTGPVLGVNRTRWILCAYRAIVKMFIGFVWDLFEADSRDVQGFAPVSAGKWSNEDLQAGQEAKAHFTLTAEPIYQVSGVVNRYCRARLHETGWGKL